MREISLDAMKQMFKQEAEDVFLVTIEINHSALVTPLRFVNNTENIIYNENTYIALPFRFELPPDLKDKPPSAKIILDNISLELIQLLRSIYDPLDIEVNIIRVSATDNSVTKEIGPFNFKMSDMKYDSTTLEAELQIGTDFLNDSAVADYFSPYLFPALF